MFVCNNYKTHSKERPPIFNVHHSLRGSIGSFIWDAVEGAEGYELRIADSEEALDDASPVSVKEAEYRPTKALSENQNYYWQTRAVDSFGATGAWSESTSLRVGYHVGTKGPAGGIIFYDKGDYSNGWRWLEAAPFDQSASVKAGYNSVFTSAGIGEEEFNSYKAIGLGKSNTELIVTGMKGEYAAGLCYDLEWGGYGDWFLPSIYELHELYNHRDTVGQFIDNAYVYGTSHTPAAVTKDRIHYWRVRAVDDSGEAGLTPAYSISGTTVSWDDTANGWCLPTEAEWEYAARGGNKSKGYKYSGSNTAGDVAWYSDNSGDKTHPVGGKAPNELGLYDMSGNVWEWCWDWKGSYSSGSQSDPRGPASGSYRVARGGGWIISARYLRSADRDYNSPGISNYNLGFRLVRREF